MYEATLSQVHTLSSLAAASPSPSNIDPEVRARVFWYAHVHEGMTTGLRGGRLVFDEDDLDTFQAPLCTVPRSIVRPPAVHSSLPSPISPTFPDHPSSSSAGPYPSSQQHPLHPGHSRMTTSVSLQHPADTYHQHEVSHHFDTTFAHNYEHGSSSHPRPNPLSTQLFALPLRLDVICRQVHALLTSSKARKQTVAVDCLALQGIWAGLDHCWEEFEQLRKSGSSGVGNGDVERFAGSWQVRSLSSIR
jgi:hypothetical protein